jgi:predicted house-cleaning noncanonical NTP pyrophosphatase (MazG superfamily)
MRRQLHELRRRYCWLRLPRFPLRDFHLAAFRSTVMRRGGGEALFSNFLPPAARERENRTRLWTRMPLTFHGTTGEASSSDIVASCRTIVVMRVDKLVRDRVPDELRRLGRTIVVTAVSDGEYVRCLKSKLVEEVDEVVNAESAEFLDELADVIEVVRALARAHKFSVEELAAAVAAKQRRLGGFDAGLFLIDNGL